MKSFFRSQTFKLVLILLCAALLGCVTASAASGGASPLTRAVDLVFTPLEKLSAAISRNLSDMNASFVSAKYYQNKMGEMQDKIDELRSQLVDYEQTAQKLADYEAVLGLKESNPDYVFAAGTVISRDASDGYFSFVLDCGASDGVQLNDPVVSGPYLVGVVKEVRDASCVAQTFLSPDVNVSAYEVRSREEGFVSGTAKLAADGLCSFSGLGKGTSVAKGGIICTSGIGGIYPRDLIVGTVTEVLDETENTAAYAVMEPGVDLNALITAFVLTDFAGKGE
ncbi:MAG: rod shape-determining protein MreC [Clostridia bacterium]|nr:rod shape-determining protein MreC [Clostridia bacterium]